MTDKSPVVHAQVFLHTAPDMTHEPTADEIRKWTQDHWPPGVSWVEIVLEARKALMDEQRGPRVQRPAVFLPDNGQWATGDHVEIRRIDQEDGRPRMMQGIWPKQAGMDTVALDDQDQEPTDG